MRLGSGDRDMRWRGRAKLLKSRRRSKGCRKPNMHKDVFQMSSFGLRMVFRMQKSEAARRLHVIARACMRLTRLLHIELASGGSELPSEIYWIF